MPTESNASIARKSRSRAEADFATWLMMAKLGSFDDLPANARQFLTNYQSRLKSMDEIGAKAATIREIQITYYAEMGGRGLLEEQKASDARTAEVVQLKQARRAREARSATVASLKSGKKPLPAWLIFAGLVVVVVLYRLLTR